MPDRHLAALPAATAIDGSELLYVVQGGDSKQATAAQLKTFGTGGLDSLTDVNVPSPVAGDALIYDADAGEWVAAPPPGSGTGGSVPNGGSEGQVLTKQSGADQDVAWGTAGWRLAGSWTYSSAVTSVPFTGLSSYTELLIIVRDLVLSVAGNPVLQLSVNNGSSYYSASGDYVSIPASGVSSATIGAGLNSTAGTSATSGVAYAPGININGTPKVIDRMSRDDAGSVLFVASSAPVTACRVVGQNGGNIAAGSIWLLGR